MGFRKLLLVFIATTLADGCIHGSLRLASKSNAGTVELCLYTQWGTISSWNFNFYDAKVVCRQLGYDVDAPRAIWNYRTDAYYGQGTGPVWTIGPQCNGFEEKILDCRTSFTNRASTHRSDVAVICPEKQCSNGDLRLVGGQVDSEGTVEICQSGSWNSLCSDEWGYQEAFVVCRQLGLPATEPQWYTSSRFGQGHRTSTLNNWRCFGNESSLTDCIYDIDSGCYHSNDVGVSCKGLKVKATCITGSMQLVGPDGPNMVEGRVEYCSDGIWGTVSYRGFDTNDAKVVCRRLGHKQPRVQMFTSSYYGKGTGPIIYSALECDGSEYKLEDCVSNYQAYYASHYHDVGIHCYEKELNTCNNGEVSLVNGSSSDQGRVEVCLQGEWGTVYDNGWDRNAAQVVCRQLGYLPAYATVYKGSHFGDGSLSVLVSYAICSGSESKLSDCSLSTGNPNALFGNTAGVRCYTPTGCNDGEVRLVGGETDKEGDVQICQQGVWGYVCADFNYWSLRYDSWSFEEARVVCQQLNYSASWYSFSLVSFFSGDAENFTAPIVTDGYDCSSTDTNLSECSAFNYGTYKPDCNNVGGVMCEENVDCTDGSVQLVDGDSSSEGRVELCSNGVWTTIGDSAWDYHDARVVCRQLGYYDEWAVAITGSYFTSGHSRIYYTFVNCNGDELKLTNCSTNTYTTNDPIHKWHIYNRAGVSCETKSPTDQCSVSDSIRLMGGANQREGRVEVCMGGYWGTVCGDEWSEEDALVVCRQAGYETQRPAFLTNATFGRGSGPVHMTSVICQGSEENLTDCEYHNGIGTDNCHHGRDAGVVCTSGAPVHYSIKASTSPSEGPFAIGSDVSLHCVVSPDPPTGSTYKWRTAVPGVSITHQDSSHSNATITIPVNHTKYGYYYCLVQTDGSTIATGFTVIEVKLKPLSKSL